MINSCFFSLVVLHDNKLTHTDLKPENILFVNSDFTMSFNVEKVSCRRIQRTKVKNIFLSAGFSVFFLPEARRADG